jgi:hypothetical protein
MSKTKITIIKLLLILSYITIYINCEGCSLKISDNKMATFKNNSMIYDNGIISERFRSNWPKPYIADFSKEIEFFYTLELHYENITVEHKELVN